MPLFSNNEVPVFHFNLQLGSTCFPVLDDANRLISWVRVAPCRKNVEELTKLTDWYDDCWETGRTERSDSNSVASGKPQLPFSDDCCLTSSQLNSFIAYLFVIEKNIHILDEATRATGVDNQSVWQHSIVQSYRRHKLDLRQESPLKFRYCFV